VASLSEKLQQWHAKCGETCSKQQGPSPNHPTAQDRKQNAAIEHKTWWSWLPCGAQNQPTSYDASMESAKVVENGDRSGGVSTQRDCPEETPVQRDQGYVISRLHGSGGIFSESQPRGWLDALITLKSRPGHVVAALVPFRQITWSAATVVRCRTSWGTGQSAGISGRMGSRGLAT
jgi:hypothetical protein